MRGNLGKPELSASPVPDLANVRFPPLADIG